MNIITYCDECGVLVRGETMAGRILCPECKAGHKRAPRQSRDSGRIPYSQRPSAETILEAVQATVHLATARATPCSS